MSPWGWRPVRTQGVWQHGAVWLRPIALAAPWISLVACLLVLFTVSLSLTAGEGVLFELPDSGLSDSVPTDLVAIVQPGRTESTVIFDDVRYSLDDGSSAAAFGEHLSERLSHVRRKTLLVLADRRTPCGHLADLAAIARMSGAENILFANRKPEVLEE